MGKFAININVAGRSYRLKVEEEDEEFVRAAATSINDKIGEFSNSYAYKDNQDLLAMVNIMFATELLKNKKQAEDSVMLTKDKLEEIDNILTI